MTPSSAASILDLPNEIQLQIVRLLLDDLLTHKNDVDPEAAAVIRRGDLELRNEVHEKHSPSKDAFLRVSKACVDAEKAVHSLASSCSFYHGILAPYIYKSIRMRNNERSGESISALMGSQQSRYVEELHFFGSTDPYPGGPCYHELHQGATSKATPRDITNATSRSVLHALAHLDLFENLHTLSIEFDFYGSDVDNGDEYKEFDCFDFSDIEDEKDVVDAEARKPWRALMKEIWNAIASSKQGHVRSLIVSNLIPKKVSVFSTKEFASFLDGIEELKLTLLGGEWTAGSYFIGGMDGFDSFTEILQGSFFDHLTRVKTITLGSTGNGPLGYGLSSPRQPLHPGQSPCLRRLSLSGIVLAMDFAIYLLDHGDVLEDVTFHECCVADVSPLASWAQFFDDWRLGNPSKIQSLTIDPLTAPLPFNGHPERIEWYYSVGPSGQRDYRWDHDLERDLKLVQERLSNGGQSIPIFSYGTPDPGLRDAVESREQANLEAFLLGHDAAAYDRFMALCERNKRASQGHFK